VPNERASCDSSITLSNRRRGLPLAPEPPYRHLRGRRLTSHHEPSCADAVVLRVGIDRICCLVRSLAWRANGIRA
jgi:hypothetical protein